MQRNFGPFPRDGKNTQCMRECCFFVANTARNSYEANQIQDAHNNKAHSQQERMMFFSATTVRKSYKAQSNQGIT